MNTPKNILLLGDRVRYSTDSGYGYGIFVMDELAGEAYVYSPKEDCRSAAYTLRNLHWWAQELHIEPEEIDVVHWNNGLWDVERIMGDQPITPIGVYADTLRRIHARIRALFPNAKVIFAATTPVIEQNSGSVLYFNADIEAYNSAARKALEPLGVAFNDLYAAAKDFDVFCYRTGELFSEQGSRLLGRAVAEAIRACINGT